MKNKRDPIQQYLQEVSRSLRCSLKRKHTLLHRLSTDIEDFAEEFDGVLTLNDLESHFGKPSEIVAELLPESAGSPQRSILRKWLPIGVIAVLLISVAVTAAALVRSANTLPEMSIYEESSYGNIYTGSKTVKCNTPSGKTLLTITVRGEYLCRYDTATPRSASLSLEVLDPDVQVNTKYAYTSGDTVYGCVNITYNGETTNQVVRLYCNARGRFS